MSNIIDLKKGLNIPIEGMAALETKKTIMPDVVAVRPGEFKGFTPRLLVKEGDKVLAGSPVLADKQNPDVLLTAPASGTVQSVVRGASKCQPIPPRQVGRFTMSRLWISAKPIRRDLMQRPSRRFFSRAVSGQHSFKGLMVSLPTRH